jgi:hypothetical protein
MEAIGLDANHHVEQQGQCGDSGDGCDHVGLTTEWCGDQNNQDGNTCQYQSQCQDGSQVLSCSFAVLGNVPDRESAQPHVGQWGQHQAKRETQAESSEAFGAQSARNETGRCN